MSAPARICRRSTRLCSSVRVHLLQLQSAIATVDVAAWGGEVVDVSGGLGDGTQAAEDLGALA